MFTNRLQALFAGQSMPVDVVAAGAGSWNTRNEYEFLRHVGIGLQPDALLLVIVPNDIEPKRDGSHTEVSQEALFPPDEQQKGWLANHSEDFWRWAARKSYLAAYLKYLWQETLNGGDRKPPDAKSPRWRDARLALDGIIDLCAERGIDLIVYLDGSAAMLDSNPVLRLYHQHLQARGIQGLPMPDSLFADPGLRISMVDSHLNATGSRILAQAMFEAIRPRFDSALGSASPAVSE